MKPLALPVAPARPRYLALFTVAEALRGAGAMRLVDLVDVLPEHSHEDVLDVLVRLERKGWVAFHDDCNLVQLVPGYGCR